MEISPGVLLALFGKKHAFPTGWKPGVAGDIFPAMLVEEPGEKPELRHIRQQGLMTYLSPWIQPCLKPSLTQDFSLTFSA